MHARRHFGVAFPDQLSGMIVEAVKGEHGRAFKGNRDFRLFRSKAFIAAVTSRPHRLGRVYHRRRNLTLSPADRAGELGLFERPGITWLEMKAIFGVRIILMI